VTLWAENWSVAPQIVVLSPAANNQVLPMPGGTSLYLLRVPHGCRKNSLRGFSRVPGTPEEHTGGADARNALAAKGYRLAYEEVRKDIRSILEGEPSGPLLSHRHQDWFRAMFQPSVQAGVIEAYKLAGYRSHNVYPRRSSHFPLPPHAIADAMDALFECIEDEPDPRAKAIVAPFLFTYIHPFPDGNGRSGRFLMNALLAEAGLPWTVVPVDQRDRDMSCLEEASRNENVRPLCPLY
jgi:Fic family protein